MFTAKPNLSNSLHSETFACAAEAVSYLNDRLKIVPSFNDAGEPREPMMIYPSMKLADFALLGKISLGDGCGCLFCYKEVPAALKILRKEI